MLIQKLAQVSKTVKNIRVCGGLMFIQGNDWCHITSWLANIAEDWNTSLKKTTVLIMSP